MPTQQFFSQLYHGKNKLIFNEMVMSLLFQIDEFEKIYLEVEEVKGSQILDLWFRVNSKPFKQALLNTIKRWSYMFKQHLADHVTNRYILFGYFFFFSY
jgi:hypothetical protein